MENGLHLEYDKESREFPCSIKSRQKCLLFAWQHEPFLGN